MGADRRLEDHNAQEDFISRTVPPFFPAGAACRRCGSCECETYRAEERQCAPSHTQNSFPRLTGTRSCKQAEDRRAIGATLLSGDESSVKDVPGLVKVVRQGNFLGVVAESEWGAIRAAQKLKANWSNWEGLPEQSKLWEHVRATKVNKDDVTSNVGNAEPALEQAAKRLSATYNFAIHTHGSIGPSCAVAEIKEGKLTCWSSSQGTHDLRQQIAAMLSMPDTDVRAIYLEGSGCYGRNGHENAAADAVLLARAVERPVRVQWMRENEHGWDPKGPPTLMDLQAGLDANGNVVAWYSQVYVPESATGSLNVKLVAAELAGLPHETGMVPGNIIQNRAIPYTFPNA